MGSPVHEGCAGRDALGSAAQEPQAVHAGWTEMRRLLRDAGEPSSLLMVWWGADMPKS